MPARRRVLHTRGRAVPSYRRVIRSPRSIGCPSPSWNRHAEIGHANGFQFELHGVYRKDKATAGPSFAPLNVRSRLEHSSTSGLFRARVPLYSLPTLLWLNMSDISPDQAHTFTQPVSRHCSSLALMTSPRNAGFSAAPCRRSSRSPCACGPRRHGRCPAYVECANRGCYRAARDALARDAVGGLV
jgi:hypothetical protein